MQIQNDLSFLLEILYILPMPACIPTLYSTLLSNLRERKEALIESHNKNITIRLIFYLKSFIYCLCLPAFKLFMHDECGN